MNNEKDVLIHKHKLLCPHTRPVDVSNVLGVVAYYHGNSCQLLNRFKVKAPDILVSFFKTRNFEDTPTIRASLAASEKVRQELYKLLSEAQTDEELIELLEKTLKIYSKTRNEEDLLQELIKTFGKTVILNLQIITGKDYARLSVSMPSYLSMRSLGPGHMKYMQETITKAKEKHTQTLHDVLFMEE